MLMRSHHIYFGFLKFSIFDVPIHVEVMEHVDVPTHHFFVVLLGDFNLLVFRKSLFEIRNVLIFFLFLV